MKVMMGPLKKIKIKELRKESLFLFRGRNRVKKRELSYILNPYKTLSLNFRPKMIN
jgi:hypothetical protein